MLCIARNYRNKLDETISKVHAGKVVGGAIGKSFSYIDWIVYDKDVFMKVFNQLKNSSMRVSNCIIKNFNDFEYQRRR